MEHGLSVRRVKSLAKVILENDKSRFSNGSIEFLTDIITDFVKMISLAGDDLSQKSNKYIDSEGVIKALEELDFEDIVNELPELSDFSEDLFKM